MALIMFDGFEAAPSVRNIWTWTAGGPRSVVGRDGVGRGFGLTNNGSIVLALPTAAVGTLVMGVGVKWRPPLQQGPGGNALISFRSNTGVTVQCLLAVNLTSHLEFRNSSGSTIVASAENFVLGAWHYIEVQLLVADAGGRCIVKVDGVVHIDYTGDTKSGGAFPTNIDRIDFGVPSAPSNTEIDDLVVMDTTGAAPFNGFVGEKVVKAKRPAGNGAVNDWLGSDGDSTDNYALVDEDPLNVTDYVSSNTAAQRDLYALSAATGLATVDAVQATVYASKSDSGARSVKALLRDDATGTVVSSGTLALSTSWQVLAGVVQLTDPSGAAWTPARANAIQAGVETV